MVATVIICLVLAALVALGIRSIRSRISVGCCGGSADPSPRKIRVADRDPAHYPYEKTLQIKGMTCRNCAVRVQNALNSLDGVFAQVNLHNGTAEVRTKSELPDGMLRKAVAGAGYSVGSIEADRRTAG